MTSDEKKAEKILERKAGTDDDAGDKSSANSIVERADAAAERLAKENEKFEANIRRQEEIMAKQTLGGRTEIKQPVQKVEPTNNEFWKKFLKGEVKAPF